jgi:hypothetical protein
VQQGALPSARSGTVIGTTPKTTGIIFGISGGSCLPTTSFRATTCVR